jgi:cellulose synthase/poly-beta-1,6-N-acetylglucosamine synthase-like glycosyltransferase
MEQHYMSITPPSPEYGSYVLVTAAYNEEHYIEQTIQSVGAQVLVPTMWVIVSDGSTDRTDEIIQRYATRYSFIRLIRRERDHNRGFASKVFALNVGVNSLPPGKIHFLGHLDGDVSLDPRYFCDLLRRFEEDPKLGLAGGWYCEKVSGEYRPCRGSNSRSIPGGIQMFRYDCYRDIGGLLPIEYGGEDWYAEIMARKCGWRVRSFPDLHVRHLRVTGTRGSRLRYCYRQGIMDFALGSHPVFELAKVSKRILSRPYLLGALARLLGFAVAYVCVDRMVAPDVVRFLRKEELARLWSVVSLLLRGKRPTRKVVAS